MTSCGVERRYLLLCFFGDFCYQRSCWIVRGWTGSVTYDQPWMSRLQMGSRNILSAMLIRISGGLTSILISMNQNNSNESLGLVTSLIELALFWCHGSVMVTSSGYQSGCPGSNPIESGHLFFEVWSWHWAYPSLHDTPSGYRTLHWYQSGEV